MLTHQDMLRYVEWTQEKLRDLAESEDYPNITATLDCPWIEKVMVLVEETDPRTLLALSTGLLGSSADLAARFTVLSINCQFRDYLLSIPDAYAKQEGEKYAKNLRFLVGLLPIEECKDRRRILWEIRNALAACHLDVALELYDRAEELALLEGLELLAPRGQVRFLSVFLDVIHRHDVYSAIRSLIQQWAELGVSAAGGTPDVIWTTGVHLDDRVNISRDNLIKDREATTWCLLITFSICSEEKDFDDDDLPEGIGALDLSLDTAQIREAVHDLARVVDMCPEKSSVYRAMLARCYLGLAEYGTAAGHYEHLLTHFPRLDFFSEVQKETLYKTLGECQSRAGSAELALKTLQRYADEYQSQSGIFSRMAAVHANRGEYEKAYECIEREKERSPDLKEDWQVSTILALGGVVSILSSADYLAERMRKSNPQFVAALDSVLTDYWPPYSALSERARKEFRDGEILARSAEDCHPARAQCLNYSALAHVKALEAELIAKVFKPFRDYVRISDELRGVVQNGATVKDTIVLCKYVLERPIITLGQMKWVLENCRDSEFPVYELFSEWSQRMFPGLLNKLRDLQWKEVVSVRDKRMAHPGELKPEEAARISIKCRQAIETLHSVLRKH